MRTCTSAANKTASEELLKQIRLRTLRSVKERVEPPAKTRKATAEGTLIEGIGIKTRLLGCRSIFVISGTPLVVLEDLSLRVRTI